MGRFHDLVEPGRPEYGTVGEDDLRTWAAAHVGEAAAAPKAVRVLDALPVTAVGKPYKLALRADATRRVLGEVLDGIGHVAEIRADTDSGSVTVTVTLRTPAPAGTAAEVARRVAGFALTCHVVEQQPGDA